jgi:hypothetical protein
VLMLPYVLLSTSIGINDHDNKRLLMNHSELQGNMIR